MNWIKKHKLPAMKAIKFNRCSYNKLIENLSLVALTSDNGITIYLSLYQLST